MATPAEQQTEAASPNWIAAAGLALLWLVMFLAGGGDWDRGLLVGAYAGDQPWMVPALFVTRLGDWEVLVAITFFAAGWLLLKRRPHLALLLVGSTLAARLLVGLQKIMLARVRPAENEHLVQVQTLSFPSGHAANSMVVYVILALLLVKDEGQRRAAVIAAVVVSLLVGVSRVLLGVHWPSDVAGGWAFGLLWVMLVWHERSRWAPAKGT
jgi:membrane-associated phospholipid phosphatase